MRSLLHTLSDDALDAVAIALFVPFVVGVIAVIVGA